MEAVQTLRAKTKAAGNLKTTSRITVVQQSPSTIVIQLGPEHHTPRPVPKCLGCETPGAGQFSSLQSRSERWPRANRRAGITANANNIFIDVICTICFDR
jgi:hypothetical protein